MLKGSNRKRKVPKGNIIKVLPKALQRELTKRKTLHELTFEDLNAVSKQLQKFCDDDPQGFLNTACAFCCSYPEETLSTRTYGRKMSTRLGTYHVLHMLHVHGRENVSKGINPTLKVK